MCGIVGGYGKDIAKGVTALIHRGPDAQAVTKYGALTFGHTRLSIIDLDARANQPFEYGRVSLVFNGEIWNYKQLRLELQGMGKVFHTESDTEVLAASLDAWGTDALPCLQGMFAIGWTTDGETLYLARDRFGETPLHIAKQVPFCFASEKKALLAMGCHPKAIADLGPGQLATVTGKGIQITQYYDAPTKPRTICRANAARKVFELVGEGSSERVMSDVPVCTLLSGGIDSAALAYWLKQSIPNLVAYTAVFKPNSSDLRNARIAADAIGIELRQVKIPLPSPRDFDTVIRCIEMDYKAQVEIGWPCLRLAEIMRSDGFKVTYSGEGSDELWASYGFAYHALKTQDWHSYRKDLFLSQARKNFMRCNKVFMASGVECRLPFLNTALVEYALSLPIQAVQDTKAKPKAVMQEAFADVLPHSVVSRPKVAFQDGLGLKQAIAGSLPSPEKYYRSLYANIFA